MKSFAEILEEELVEQSEALEEKHFDAAFEAKVAEIENESTATAIDNNVVAALHLHQNHLSHQQTSCSYGKSNCYSPYVPSNALRIQGMIEFIQLRPTDVFCDMGCGDGRVCFVVAAAQHNFLPQKQRENGSNESINIFRAIGIDVSKDCIDMAEQHLKSNPHLSVDVKRCIQFYQADLTIHPDELLNGMVSCD